MSDEERQDGIRELERVMFPTYSKLGICCSYLYDAGYEDIHFILSLSEQEWDIMLDALADEAKRVNGEFKPGHRTQFRRRIKELQLKPPDDKNTEEAEKEEKEPLKGNRNKPDKKNETKRQSTESRKTGNDLLQQEGTTSPTVFFRSWDRLIFLLDITLSRSSQVFSLAIAILFWK